MHGFCSHKDHGVGYQAAKPFKLKQNHASMIEPCRPRGMYLVTTEIIIICLCIGLNTVEPPIKKTFQYR